MAVMSYRYIVCKVFSWSSIESGGRRLESPNNIQAKGYAVVYDDLTKLRKDFPNEEYITVEADHE